MLNDNLTLDQLQWLPNRSFSPISWSRYRAWHPLNYEWLSWRICIVCDMPRGEAYSSGHLASSLFWAYVLLLRQVFPCHFSTFQLEYPSVRSRFCLVFPQSVPCYRTFWCYCFIIGGFSVVIVNYIMWLGQIVSLSWLKLLKFTIFQLKKLF